MKKYQMNLKDAIREKINIVDVIGRYTELKQSGRNLKGKSPFTNEKTGSFFVNVEKNLFYCFSSQKGGDVFTFIQEIEGVDFVEALKILAEQVGIDPADYQTGSSKNYKEEKQKKEKLVSTLLGAEKYFEQNLNDMGRKYLKDRSVSDASVKEWHIGFAPDVKGRLIQVVQGADSLEKSGLIGKNYNSEYYDRFRNRLMFPLHNEDHIIGFAGRILEDAESAKYINSPETPLYNKSEYLYGFHFAKQHIRKYGFSILTEGYFDVILAHQAGYKMTVAVSGTAATEGHFSILSRYSKNILFALDGDAAGIRALFKSAKLALRGGLNIKIIEIKDGKDPADIISENPVVWKEGVKNAKPLLDFMLDHIDSTTSDIHTKSTEVYEKILPLISAIENPMISDAYISTIASYLKVEMDSIKKILEVQKKNVILPKAQNQKDTDLILKLKREFFAIIEYLKEESEFSDNEEKILSEISEFYSTPYRERETPTIQFSADFHNKLTPKDYIKKIKAELSFLYKRLLCIALKVEVAETMKAIDREGVDKSGIAILEKRCQNAQARIQQLAE